ncbi:GL20371 [Drosophila persimilis]|uniref:GL20371 n=1 Tax=Drosophila persimilis TaxID=7234 RepID=B4GXY5_DROPE|nr:GL20371 [Drosophila persimilis]
MAKDMPYVRQQQLESMGTTTNLLAISTVEGLPIKTDRQRDNRFLGLILNHHITGMTLTMAVMMMMTLAAMMTRLRSLVKAPRQS